MNTTEKNTEKSEVLRRQLMQEAEELKQVYPGFSIEGELQNRNFARMLSAGIPMRVAYQALHHEEIMEEALEYTAKHITEKVTNDLAARGARPSEGALGASAAASEAIDPTAFTKEERKALRERIMRGERVVF